jgi:hypothetical protein
MSCGAHLAFYENFRLKRRLLRGLVVPGAAAAVVAAVAATVVVAGLAGALDGTGTLASGSPTQPIYRRLP